MKKNAIRAAVLERIVPSVLMFSMILTSFGNIAVADDTEAQPVDSAPAEVITPAVEVTDTPAVVEDETTEVVIPKGELPEVEEENLVVPPTPEFLENTVEDDANEEPKDPTLDLADAVIQELVMPMVVQIAPAAFGTCSQTTTVHSTDLTNWDLSQSSQDGSGTSTIVDGGLRVKTDVNGHRKAAGYYSTNFALANLGTNSIASTLEYSTNSGSIAPGFQLVVDFDNNGSTDGILVGETVYGNNWWLPANSSQQFVKAGAPHMGGGNGSNWYGTAEEWSTNFPNARVKAIGYSLGSGVTGDYTITKIFAGCTNYTFGLPPADTAAPAIPTGLAWIGADTVSVPHNGGTDQYNGTASWNANSETDFSHYIYKYWNDIPASPYKSEATSWQSNVAGVSNTSYSGEFNQGEGTHHFCVAAVDMANNQSACSEVFTITYDVTAPEMPVHVSPANNSSQNFNDFYFEWTDVDGAVEYEFQSSQNPATDGDGVLTTGVWNNKTNGSPDRDTLTESSIHSYGASGTWYWQVRAIDIAGNTSDWTTPWKLTIDAVPPTAPQIIFPTNGQIFASAPILNDWTDSTDADGIDKYEIEYIYSDGHTFVGGPYRETAGNVSQRNHSPALSEQGGVTIRVRAYDNAGNVSGWSNSVYYIYDVDGTHTSRIIEPTDAEVVSGTTDLVAFYADQNGDNNDAVQWAVRAGTCAANTGTVFGNVDGKNTPFTFVDGDFSASIDTTTVANGSYCFVFNPTEDAGNMDQRLTRTFTINNAGPVDPVDPTDPVITNGTVTVRPSAMQGWEFNSDRSTWTMGVGEIVNGPTGSLNLGSARLTTPGANDRTKLRMYMEAGTQVSDIIELKYSTYRAEPTGGALTLALQFDVDMDSTPLNPASADARIVYEPYYTQTIIDDEWQTWNTLADIGTGNWWIAGPGGGTTCTISNPCTWTELNTNYPDLQISSKSLENTIDTQGAVLFKAGGSWAGFDGNVDNLIIGIKDGIDIHTTTYDFEPDPVVVTEPEPASTGGSNGRSGGRRSTTGGQVLGASTSDSSSTGGQVLGASCPLIATYLREGMDNDAEQVMSLQGFLNGELGISLALSGMFDAVTTSAVKVFQSKYASEVLLPWGLTAETPTGYVYKSTTWKINDIACPDLEVAFPQIP